MLWLHVSSYIFNQDMRDKFVLRLWPCVMLSRIVLYELPSVRVPSEFSSIHSFYERSCYKINDSNECNDLLIVVSS